MQRNRQKFPCLFLLVFLLPITRFETFSMIESSNVLAEFHDCWSLLLLPFSRVFRSSRVTFFTFPSFLASSIPHMSPMFPEYSKSSALSTSFVSSASSAYTVCSAVPVESSCLVSLATLFSPASVRFLNFPTFSASFDSSVSSMFPYLSRLTRLLCNLYFPCPSHLPLFRVFPSLESHTSIVYSASSVSPAYHTRCQCDWFVSIIPTIRVFRVIRFAVFAVMYAHPSQFRCLCGHIVRAVGWSVTFVFSASFTSTAILVLPATLASCAPSTFPISSELPVCVSFRWCADASSTLHVSFAFMFLASVALKPTFYLLVTSKLLAYSDDCCFRFHPFLLHPPDLRRLSRLLRPRRLSHPLSLRNLRRLLRIPHLLRVWRLSRVFRLRLTWATCFSYFSIVLFTFYVVSVIHVSSIIRVIHIFRNYHEICIFCILCVPWAMYKAHVAHIAYSALAAYAVWVKLINRIEFAQEVVVCACVTQTIYGRAICSSQNIFSQGTFTGSRYTDKPTEVIFRMVRIHWMSINKTWCVITDISFCGSN